MSDPISGLGAVAGDAVQHMAVAASADDALLHKPGKPMASCHNCQAPLAGPFCSACGQRAGHLHKPIWELMHDFLHSVLHWDGRIWTTLRAMLLAPARHANDWINGRQMRYVPPIRLFVFISLLLIVALGFTDVVLWQLKKRPMTGANLSKIYAEQNSHLECLLKSVSPNAAVGVECGPSRDVTNSYDGKFLALEDRTTGLKDDLISVGNLQINGDETKARGFMNLINGMMKHPRQFNDAVSRSLSKYLLIAVPLHALLLKIFYIRRKRYLMEHVIFSLQSHTVLFLLLLLCVLLAWISRGWLEGGMLISGLFIVYAVHLFVAMKRFYGQGLVRTSFKYMCVGGLYFLLMAAMGTALLVRSLGGFFGQETTITQPN